METHSLVRQERFDDILDQFPDAFSCLPPEAQRVSLAVYRVLAQGEPASRADIARRAKVSEESVAELLGRWSGVYLDEEGRVISYWGLALPEMAHQFDVEGRTLYTWCAWDALFLPELLGATARVTSRSPVTGKRIRLRVSPKQAESLDGAAIHVSFLEPEAEAISQDVMNSFCHYVFFFLSAEEGKQWVQAHRGTYLLTLDEAFALGKRKNALQYGDTLRR